MTIVIIELNHAESMSDIIFWLPSLDLNVYGDSYPHVARIKSWKLIEMIKMDKLVHSPLSIFFTFDRKDCSYSYNKYNKKKEKSWRKQSGKEN